MVQFIAEATVGIDAYKKAAREFRISLTEGAIGDPAPVFRANPAYVPPAAAVAGLFQRLDELVKRIRVAPNYTPEIGALLGIVPQSPSRPAPGTVQPMLKVETLPGSIVNVAFKRGFSDGVSVEIKVDNATTWSDAGRFFKSPAQLTIPENPQNLPRSVQIRARYVEGDTPVGQYSPVDIVSTQPAG